MGQRLIDANALMDALNVFKDRKNGNEHFMYGIETAKELLGIQPTVDAVPVSYIYKRAMELKNDDMMYAYTVLNSLIANYRADGERRSDENVC